MTLEQRLKDQNLFFSFSDYHISMSNNNAHKTLLKASTKPSDKGGVQHFLAIVKSNGSFDMSGLHNIVSAILNNVSFHQNLNSPALLSICQGMERF